MSTVIRLFKYILLARERFFHRHVSLHHASSIKLLLQVVPGDEDHTLTRTHPASAKHSDSSRTNFPYFDFKDFGLLDVQI